MESTNPSDKKTGKILVFSAPSGAGKTTILEHLRSVMPGLVYSISATTRPPRDHEINGVHYFFLNEDAFKRRIEADEFAEWEIVHGNYYGTPKSFINSTIQAGRHIILDIDVYGKAEFDAVYPGAIGIFIKPPSLEELERRLRNRKTDSDEVISLRLENAKKEMAFAERKGKYEYTIINDDLDKTKRKVVALVKNIIDG